MTTDLEELRRAFASVFQPQKPPRLFRGAGRRHEGFSDDFDGVQWNAGVDHERGVVTVGVNLEGKEYEGWPIARFIAREQAALSLPELARTYSHAHVAELWFSRDAWQFQSRPPIREQHIGPEPPVYLSNLSEGLWRDMLVEASGCLRQSPSKIGRAQQLVTLAEGRREMWVSPHIQVKVVARRSTYLRGLESDLQVAKHQLQPVRELIQRQCGC